MSDDKTVSRYSTIDEEKKKRQRPKKVSSSRFFFFNEWNVCDGDDVSQ